MKMKKLLVLFATAALFTSMFTSCKVENSDNHNWIYYPNMLVTVKTAEDGRCYFQLDDKTTLLPENVKKSPYKGQPRALANCTELEGDATPYDKLVKVHWYDSILTKKAVMTSGIAEDEALYGNDPVEILDNWVTVVEDGYLTLQFAAMFSDLRIPHYINLVMGVDPENPYVLELRHDAKGDYQMCTRRTGLVAFDITDLPDTEGETVKLVVKYKGFSNSEKSYSFDYCTGGVKTQNRALSSDVDTSLDLK